MELMIKKIGNIIIARILQKRFTSQDASEFRDTLARYIREGNILIILDLSAVDFMDSSAFGSIVTTYQNLQAHIEATKEYGKLAVFGLSANTATLFSIFKLDSLVGIYNNEQSAIQALSN